MVGVIQLVGVQGCGSDGVFAPVRFSGTLLNRWSVTGGPLVRGKLRCGDSTVGSASMAHRCGCDGEAGPMGFRSRWQAEACEAGSCASGFGC